MRLLVFPIVWFTRAVLRLSAWLSVRLAVAALENDDFERSVEWSDLSKTIRFMLGENPGYVYGFGLDEAPDLRFAKYLDDDTQPVAVRESLGDEWSWLDEQ